MDIYKNIQNELQKLNDEIDELDSVTEDMNDSMYDDYESKEDELSNYEEELEEYEDEINQLQESIKETQKKIDELHIEISKDKSGKEALQKNIDDNDAKIEDLRRKAKELITSELMKTVFTINNENSYRVYISKDTATTGIMDEFVHSGKDFLLMECAEWNYKYDYNSYAFIVTKSVPGADTYSLQPTMTELKQNKGPHRLKDLRGCMETAVKKYQETKNKIIPFDKPCLLGGQTYANRTGYGWEWLYGNLISEGTLYGEVTDFFILGVVKRSQFTSIL